MIPAPKPGPGIAFLRDLVPVGDAGLLVFHACFIEKWSCFHGGVIVFAVGQFAKVENFVDMNCLLKIVRLHEMKHVNIIHCMG